MGLLKKLGGEQAYLKAGLFGWQGSGKTRTSTEIAIGLAKHIGSTKPIAFFDTETGSDFVEPLVRAAGLEFIGHKSKAFVDLLQVMKEAQDVCDILIIDSVTHVWNELCDAYCRKKYECRKCFGTGAMNGVTCGKCNGSGAISDRLAMWDYAPIKREWRDQFVDPMLNARLHIIICGRAGNEYESQTNLEGKIEIVKGGTKMKAESEFGFETSLLIEMEKEKTDAGIINKAFIWKDRFDQMNGKEFKMPKFADFLPHISLLNIGGAHVATNNSNSVASLKTPHGSSEEYITQKKILGEEISALLTTAYPSNNTDDKKAKIVAMEACFGTPSWTAVETMHPDAMREGKEKLKAYLDKMRGTVAQAAVVEKKSDVAAEEKTIALEMIKADLLAAYPGNSAEDKAGKIAAMKACFDTPSWTAIEALSIDELRLGHGKLQKQFKQKSTKTKGGKK